MYIEDGNATMRILPDALISLQQEVCRQFDSAEVYPDVESKMGVAIASLHRMPITACRLSPENGTNGWYIWGGQFSDKEDFFQPLHLAHLPEMLPQVLRYLALAPGYKFMIDHEGYEDVWFDPHLLTE